MSIQIDGTNSALRDANNNELVSYTSVASAVNQVVQANAATGNAPSSGVAGDDTNIDYVLSAKGTGKVRPDHGMLFSAVPPSFGRLALAMTDANTTLTNVQYNNLILGFTGTLTAGRNIVLPLTDGATYIVFNGTTGGFALTFIATSGTGIAVAAGKRAIIYCDGTNYVRVTADV